MTTTDGGLPQPEPVPADEGPWRVFISHTREQGEVAIADRPSP